MAIADYGHATSGELCVLTCIFANIPLAIAKLNLAYNNGQENPHD